MSDRFETSDDERRAIDSQLAAAPSCHGTGEYIEDVLRERMRREIAHDTAQFRRMTGLDFGHWSV